ERVQSSPALQCTTQAGAQRHLGSVLPTPLAFLLCGIPPSPAIKSKPRYAAKRRVVWPYRAANARKKLRRDKAMRDFLQLSVAPGGRPWPTRLLASAEIPSIFAGWRGAAFCAPARAAGCQTRQSRAKQGLACGALPMARRPCFAQPRPAGAGAQIANENMRLGLAGVGL